jgi:hypothetical protein
MWINRAFESAKAHEETQRINDMAFNHKMIEDFAEGRHEQMEFK